MRVWVTGANGRLGKQVAGALTAFGHEQVGTLPTLVEGTDFDVDVTDFATVQHHAAAHRPDLVIHCAALTNVDYCAQNPDEANRVNAYGAQNVAVAAASVGAAICHISSNEVFDGEKNAPYLEYDPTRPINPYAYSKWAAEQAVQHVNPRHYIVRTAWLFAHDGVNFLPKIAAAARAGKPLSVVTDEIASPTYVEDFVPALLRLAATGRFGTYHLVNGGIASRYEFARRILDCCGLPDYPITPISRTQFQRASSPPAYTPLRNYAANLLGITLPPWQEAVAAFFAREARDKQG